MLDLILRTGLQLGRQPGVRVGIAGGGCRAGEWMGADGVTPHRHQQLWRGADQPVDREPVAGGEGGLEASEHGVDVDRLVGRDIDRPGDHRLVHVALTDRLPGRCDSGQIAPDVDPGADRERCSGRGRSARQLGEIELGAVDTGHPPTAVDRLGDHDARHDQGGGRSR